MCCELAESSLDVLAENIFNINPTFLVSCHRDRKLFSVVVTEVASHIARTKHRTGTIWLRSRLHAQYSSVSSPMVGSSRLEGRERSKEES